MTSQLRVPFGLSGDRLYEPHQVQNGKKCGCICPGCKRPLIAKQGSKTPHFAHEPGEDCAYGLETAVHLAAKQIISDRQQVRLPAVKYLSPFNGEILGHALPSTISLDAVVQEFWLGDMRPDIVVTKDDQDYLVEIAVTHFVDVIKQAKIDARQTPTFEIDASSIKNDLTFEALTDLLYGGPYQAQWLYHPRLVELAKQAELEYQNRLEAEQAAQMAAYRMASSKSSQERLERFEKLKRYRELPIQQKLERNLRVLGIDLTQLERLTTFVAWEGSFGVPREVWQSAVLVYITRISRLKGKEIQGYDGIYSDQCAERLKEVFTVKPPVRDGDSIAVWKYFKHLEGVGVLQHLRRKEFGLKISFSKWFD
jgi:hypothetical protein